MTKNPVEQSETFDKEIKDCLNEFEFQSFEKEIVQRASAKRKSLIFKSLLYRSRYAYAAALILLLFTSVYLMRGILVGYTNPLPAGPRQDKFEIYLVRDPLSVEGDINKLALDFQPILTLEDIEYCIWEDDKSHAGIPGGSGKNTILLKLKETADISMRVNEKEPYGVKYVPFVLEVNGERIFKGAFYSALSSLSPPSDVKVLCEIMGASAEREYYFVETDDENAVHDKRIYDTLNRNNLIGNTATMNSFTKIDIGKEGEVSVKTLIDDGQKWVWKKKIITNARDIEKIIDYLNSIGYKSMKQEAYDGQGLYVEFKGEKDYTFAFGGNVAIINGKVYGIKLRDHEGMRRIFDTLKYDEIVIQNPTQ